MRPHSPLLFAALGLSAFAAACGSLRSDAAVAAETAPTDGAAARQDPKEDRKAREEVAQKRKKLQSKRRELGRAELEDRIADLDREAKEMAAAHELRQAEQKLEAARRELETFVKATRPREIEERHINLDRAMHRAEHSAEELAELEAMYAEDEFARNTKELVLKRGRRDAEMAERQLEVERQELEEFEKHTLPAREKKLRQAVVDAEVALEKARMGRKKTRLEIELSARKTADARRELEMEIHELEREIDENLR